MSSFLPTAFSAAALAVHWQPRRKPLAPLAVAARGAAALRLAKRLLADNEPLERFDGVAGRELLVLQVNAAPIDSPQPSTLNGNALLKNAGVVLPWVDGVQYLGKDPAAPALLLPTNYGPVIPEEILQRVFLPRGAHIQKLAILVRPDILVPMDRARPVSRAVLLEWLERQKSGALS